MNIWKRLFGGSQKTNQATPLKEKAQSTSTFPSTPKSDSGVSRALQGPIRVRIVSIKYVDVMMPEFAVRDLLSGSSESTLMANLFRAINPRYPEISAFGSTVGTPTDKEARLALITERMKNVIRRNTDLSCVVQLRNVTMQISTGPTRLPTALCTVFANESNSQGFL